MLTLLTPLHAIAVRRGDGLRSELAGSLTRGANPFCTASGESKMSREQDNKGVVGRWFDGFWGNPWNPKVIDELAAPNMLLQYSLHAPRRGREDVRNFMMTSAPRFRTSSSGALPISSPRAIMSSVDGKVAGPTPDLRSAIFSLARCRRHPVGRCTSRVRPSSVSRTARSRKIGLDDGVTALMQLGILKAA